MDEGAGYIRIYLLDQVADLFATCREIKGLQNAWFMEDFKAFCQYVTTGRYSGKIIAKIY